MFYKKHALIKIGKICNNKCLGCSITTGENPFTIPTETIKKELLAIKKQGFQSVELIGGEVTIQNNFLDLLEFTHSLFPEIALVTNGRIFAYEKYTQKIAKICPKLDLEIALHGHNAELHNSFTQTPQSFQQTLQGIKNIIKYKESFGTLGINTLITKINYKEINKILDLILDFKYFKEWYLLSFVPTTGRALQNKDRLFVSYSDLLSLNNTLNKAYPYFNSIDLNEFPYCLIDSTILKEKSDKIHIINSDIIEQDENGIVCNYNPTFSFNDPNYLSNISVSKNIGKYRQMHSSFRTKISACQKCFYKKKCGGIWKEYLNFFELEKTNEEIQKLKINNCSVPTNPQKNVLLLSIDTLLILPLGLMYLKSFAFSFAKIKNVFNIDIHTFLTADFNFSQLDQFIQEEKPIAIGFSLGIWNEKIIIKTIAKIKTKYPNIQIIIGGPQAGNYYANNCNIDFLIEGEGEIKFLNILENNFKKNRELKNYPKLNLEKLTSPFTQNIIDISQYSSYLIFETMRGCSYNCAFCEESVRIPKVRYFPMGKIKKELEYVLDQANFLEIVDNNFNLHQERFVEICSFLKQIQKKYTRPKKISATLNYNTLTQEHIKLLKEAGVKKIELALQTTNPYAYKFLNRFPLNLDKFKKILSLFDENFEINIDIILGLPGDTLKGFLETINFINHCRTKAKVQIYCEQLKILPKTLFAKQADLYQINYQKEPPYYEISNFSFSKKEIIQAREKGYELIKNFNKKRGQIN